MTSYEYPDRMPKNFNFIAKLENNYYTINTYNNTFSKSLEWDKETIISYKISNKEKKRVFELIKENDIISYPNYFTPSTHVIIRPTENYYFKCTYNSANIEIN